MVVADLRARQPRGHPEERVRRLVDNGDPVAGTGERSRSEEDEVVGARTQDDVLRIDIRVARDGGNQLRVAAVGIAVDVGQRVREGLGRRGAGRRGSRVRVEAQHLLRTDSRHARRLCGRDCPRVGPELRR